MKVEFIDDDRFIVYYSLILDNLSTYSTEDIKKIIKLIVVRLKKKYDLKLSGYYYLDVYLNKIMILEFRLIDDYDDDMDLNIRIHLDADIYLKFDDYFLVDGHKYFYNGKYYMSIDNIDFSKYIEQVEFIYGDDITEIKNKGIIV